MRLARSVMVAGSLMAAPCAAAADIRGPGVAVEQAVPAQIRYTDGREDAPEPDLKVARRRYEATLLAPIPLRLLGGMFVAKADLFKERRTGEGADQPPAENDLENPNVAGFGAIYLPHAKEGAPRFFVVAERYGYLSFGDRAGPMSEYILGADFAADDLPYRLAFAPSDDATTRLLVRYRQFPGFERWILLVGHKIQRATGWTFDVTIPSHVLAGWQTDDAAWKLYGGVKWASREYPFSTASAEGWVDGFTATRFAGVRRAVAKPLYVALEAGVQRETLKYVDEDGETLARQETEFAPWARLALETWIAAP